MTREATLFDAAGGSPVRGYLLLKSKAGSANIPPNWIERTRTSRKGREDEIAELIKSGKMADVITLEGWEENLKKEFFYLGIRVLLDLERNGESDL